MNAIAVLNAKQAIAKHVNWKIVLKFAITMEEQLTEEQIRTIQYPRLCSIGRWLELPGVLRMQTHPAYCDLIANHVRFHREMMTIAELISSARFERAAVSISEGSGFSRASLALARSITAFNAVHEIMVPS